MKKPRYKGEITNKLDEVSKDEIIRSMLASADTGLVSNVKRRYYAIADNMDIFVRALNNLNGETGEFSADLKNAKMTLKWFNKLTLGKFL